MCDVFGIYMYVVCSMHAYTIMDYIMKFQPAADCMYHTGPIKW